MAKKVRNRGGYIEGGYIERWNKKVVTPNISFWT